MAITKPNKPKNIYHLLYIVLIFDAIMRITPPLSLFAVSVVAVAAYKSSPTETKRQIKSTIKQIRKDISRWIDPDKTPATKPPTKSETDKDPDEYEFDEEGDIEQDAKKFNDRNQDIEFRKPA